MLDIHKHRGESMKKPPLAWSLLLGGLALTLATAPALAQTETAPPPPPPGAGPPTTVVAPAYASGGAGIGVGASVWLSGLAGAQFVYDQYMFHVEGLLAFQDLSPGMGMPSSSQFDFGVAGWYHLSHGINSDFSIGGGFGIDYASFGGGGGSATAFVLEPGAQARVFLSPNFALTGRVGFRFVLGDAGTGVGNTTTIALGGQATAGFGFTYFFR
jgi:hypothetical protein